MPVVPFYQRPAPAIPDWAMPSDTHFAMAAAEYFQQLQRQQANMPEFSAPEPEEKFRRLKNKERDIEARQETAPESSLRRKPKEPGV